MARKYTRPAYPVSWHVAEVARIRGQVLTPGREVRISGERGRFAFMRHVANVSTGTEWIDVRDANGALRAFRPERVSRVLRTRTMRQARQLVAETMAGAA